MLFITEKHLTSNSRIQLDRNVTFTMVNFAYQVLWHQLRIAAADSAIDTDTPLGLWQNVIDQVRL